MTTRDLDGALASYFEREATADGAATILEATLEQTSRRGPRPGWVVAVRGMTVGPTLALGPRTRSRIGYALVLAALLAAIVVGALFLAGTRPPQLSESLPCVGQPATLCGHTAGVWTSATFLPGLTLTFPDDRWFTREQPEKLELKALPMTSSIIVQLDPLPAGPSSDHEPGRAGDVANLIRWLSAAPGAANEMVGERTTPAGLSVTTLDVKAADPRVPVGLLVARANPAGAAIVEANHYAQRLHFVDLGGGHVLSILVVAYDSNRDTVRRTDVTFRSILDSIRPPTWPNP